MNKTHALRSLALGAAAIALLSGPMATDANAMNADETPNWAAPQGFFVEPEAIFMQFTNSNADYAAVGDHSSFETSSVDSDYEMGWRFGIGYRWENRWSIGLRWTSVDGNESDWATAKAGDAAFNFLTASHGDAVRGEIDRDLDIVDFEVSRTWGDLDGHHMRLFFGPRYMTYDQTLEAMTYDAIGGAFDWGGSRYDVEAWGVRVGIEGHVALGHETGWTFFGYAAVSALMTNSDAAWAQDYDLTDSTWDFAASDDDDESSTGLEAGLGFQWAHEFDNWNFGIRFGWELSNYTDFVGGSADADSGVDLASSDDLGLNGGFVRFSFTW